MSQPPRRRRASVEAVARELGRIRAAGRRRRPARTPIRARRVAG